MQIAPITEAPNLAELKERFGVSEDDVIIAYGDKIYCPVAGMSRDLMVHELVHCQRQGMNAAQAERWWKKYMEDDKFRLNEESLAYREQFRFCKKVYKDRNRQTKILYALANDLSSGRYGNICIHSEAVLLIDPH